MNKRILCVDDDLNILRGFKRTLRGKFNISTSSSGPEALALMQESEPFAVVVSDMRMPEMNGVQFLTRVKEISPDSVRVMLTGNSDQQTATDAVNEGAIFRFLTKPCPPELFAQTLNSALEQYGLITAERELLQGTLNRSLQVLVDILALVNSTAFTRSTRVKRMAGDMANGLGISNVWEIEIAAMLSQIGCVTVPEHILLKVLNGDEVNDEELNLYQKHPQVASELISKIPRLERIAGMISNQNRRFKDDPESQLLLTDVAAENLGARILKIVLDFNKLLESNELPDVAFKELNNRNSWYDPEVLNALKKLIEERSDEFTSKEVHVSELKAGMILEQSLLSSNDTLLLSEGQEITHSLIMKLVNFSEANVIPEIVNVRVPVNGHLQS
ncbi:MAG: response regulator [Pyrinomonadaceae bacterium]|nr:response regulator [Pyrinomonadaceae bacterium]